MRRREFYWSIYHLTEKRRLDDLKTDQVEAVFEAFTPAQQREWVVWKEGFDSWKPFEDFHTLLVSLRRQPAANSTLPPEPTGESSSSQISQNTQGGAGQDANQKSAIVQVGRAGVLAKVNTIDPAKFNDPSISLSLDGRARTEDRVGVRYQIRLEMRIVTPQQTYKFWTQDVSLSGIRFEGTIPSNLPRYFNVELRNGDVVIPLICSILHENGQPTTDRLRIEVNDHIKVMQTLLMAAG